MSSSCAASESNPPKGGSAAQRGITPVWSPRVHRTAAPLCIRPSGGRAWWAHFEFTRMNIELTILPKKFEDLRILGAFFAESGLPYSGSRRKSHVGSNRAPGVTAVRRRGSAGRHEAVNLLGRRDIKRTAGRPSLERCTSVEEGAVEPLASGLASCVAAPATPVRVHRCGDSDPGPRHRHDDGGLYDRVRRAASTTALS